MTHSKTGAPEDTRSDVVSRQEKQRNTTSPRAKVQPFDVLAELPQTRMMTAFTAALDDIDGDAEKAALCRWVAERGLLGVAFTQGLVAAAAHGYQMADKLAEMRV